MIPDDNTITDVLTAQQHHHIRVTVQILKCDTRITHAEVLIQEMIYTLLDPQCYIQADQHFTAKLKLIAQSIRDRTWKPSPRYQERISQLENDLKMITSQLSYCHERIRYALTHPNVDRGSVEKEKAALETEQDALQQQLLILNPPTQETTAYVDINQKT